MRHSATLQVNVDHGHYVNVVELRRGVAQDLELTTIAVNQRRARIELAVSADSRRESLTTVELTNLPTNLGRKPRIALETAVTRRGSLQLSFVVEGRRVTSRTVSVRKWLPTRHALWLAPLAVLVAALLVWLGFRLFAAGDPTMAVPVAEGPSAEVADGTDVGGRDVSDDGTDRGADRGADRPGAGGGPGGADDRDATAAEEPAEADDRGDSGADREGGSDVGTAGETMDAAGDGVGDEQPTPEMEAISREWTVYFRPDDPTLTATTRTRLSEIIDTVRESAGDERGIAELRLIGHCALAGTEAGRVELSQARAGNVWRFLSQNGFGEPEELTVRGVGGQEPVTLNAEEQHLNRRVEISLRLEPRS